MKYPKIEVAYNIVFNNTGFDWVNIQDAICEIVEKKYNVLHCITTKYNERNNIGGVRYEIQGVCCLFYFSVNTETLNIDVIAIKEDNRPIENECGMIGGVDKCVID